MVIVCLLVLKLNGPGPGPGLVPVWSSVKSHSYEVNEVTSMRCVKTSDVLNSGRAQ